MRNVIFRAAAGLILAAFSAQSFAVSCPAGKSVEFYSFSSAGVEVTSSSEGGIVSALSSQLVAVHPVGSVCQVYPEGPATWKQPRVNPVGDSVSGVGDSVEVRQFCGIEPQYPELSSSGRSYSARCVDSSFCEYEVGEQFTGGAFTLGDGGDLTVSQNDTFCYQTCEVTLKGGGLVFSAAGATSVPYYYEVTNAFCEPEQDSPPTGPGASGLGPDEVFGCEVVAGLDVCLSSDPACIVIEGEKICESAAGGVCGPDECLADGVDLVKNPNGSELGKPDIDTPPAPDTGTAGEKAPPDLAVGSTGADGVLGTGDGETSADYWAPGTAGNSTTNGGGEGDCDPETEDCEGEGDGECDPETEDCEDGGSGDFGGPELEEVPTIGESLSAYKTRVENSPLISAIRGAALSVPSGGSCPDFSVPWFDGQTITTDAHCAIFDDIAGLLSAIMILVWSIIALYVLLRA